jgi:hypothetical protein
MLCSVVVGDKVHDIKYKKFGNDWQIYLGDKLLGEIYRPTKYRKGFDVNIIGKRFVKGLISRIRATELMLSELGYYSDEDKDMLDYIVFKINMRD